MVVDLDMVIKRPINWTVCSGINTLALIVTKTAINRVIAGKRL